MRIEAPSRNRRYPTLTSLIDVIFLLLLFFMLSSTFSKYSELDVVGALSGGNKDGRKPDMFAQLTTDGLRINGQKFVLENIADLVKEFGQQDNISAILHVGEKVNSQELMSAVEQLSRHRVKVTVIR